MTMTNYNRLIKQSGGTETLKIREDLPVLYRFDEQQRENIYRRFLRTHGKGEGISKAAADDQFSGENGRVPFFSKRIEDYDFSFPAVVKQGMRSSTWQVSDSLKTRENILFVRLSRNRKDPSGNSDRDRSCIVEKQRAFRHVSAPDERS